MIEKNDTNPAAGAGTFPKRTSEVPTHPGSVGATQRQQGEVDAEKIANRLAHKANKREQDYDDANNNLFTK